MKIGLIGLAKSGKTTVFNALAGANADVCAYSTGKTEPNVANVPVFDERVRTLSRMYNPKKTVYASLELVDFVGVSKEKEKQELFAADLMRLIKTMNALGIVLANFESETAPELNCYEQLDLITEEMLLSDQIVAERRLEKIQESFKKGQQSMALQIEQKALHKALEALEALKPIRMCEFTADENKTLKGFQFLTQKPCFAIVNSSETRFGKDSKLLDAISQRMKVIEFAGAFEMELSRLNDEKDAQTFMADMGITQSARERLIRCAYETLGYISFFTVGDDEVKAWEISRGSTALEAAGTIHSDLARGFVRAECFSYSDLIQAGSEKAVKEKGLLRLEGKNYIVKDGDILYIRFNV